MRLLLITSFIINTFVSFTQMNMQGSTTGACDCYTLTDAVAAQKGAIWSPSTIDMTAPFDFTFDINLGCNDVWGADGMVFVLQQNPSGLGDIGNGIGYGNYGGNPTPISVNSIGVEIDTWDSSPTVVTDIASDHVGMNSAGNNSHDVLGPLPIPNIEDCLQHSFQVTWDPVLLNFEVLIDGVSIFVYNGDMVTNFFGGNPNVYFGWTAGTGGVMNVHSVCMYRNAAFTPDQTTVCANQLVTFTDNSTSDLNMITNWAWDFGDGNTSTSQNATHSYAAPGVYTAQLTITDISGCTDVVTTNITVNPGLTLNMSQQNVSCFGLNDGEATATPANGVGPYAYTWDDGLSQTTQTATGLSPNTYNVIVTDVNGCAGSGAATITEPALLQFNSVTVVDASCGANNGTITIVEAGGTAGYLYSIDGGVTQQATGVFTALAANNYTVEIEDANGCTIAQNEILNSNSSMSLDNLVATDETCGQSDGTITATVSLGAVPYQYSIDAGATYQASNVFTALAGGNYTLQVLDLNGCIVSGNVTVNSPSTLQIDLVTPTNPSCAGIADGQIVVTTVSGGTGPYTYSIDNGVTFQGGTSFGVLLAGNYTVVVEDATGCQTNNVIALIDPAAVLIDNVIITNTLCNGGTDGSIEIIASGGAGGYTYSIDAGTSFQVGNVFNALPSANYSIQVNDVNGCSAASIEFVGEPLSLQIDNIIVTDVTCNGVLDGEVEIFASQGTGPYTYSTDNVNFSVINPIVGLGAGNVTVYVNDVNGCAVSGNAVILESQPLVATLTADTTICTGGSATICPTINGGTAPFNFTWNGVFAGNMPCLTTPTAGAYDVILTDANGCTSAIVSQLVIVTPPLGLNAGTDATVCAGDAVQLNADGNGGNGGPYTYTWTNDVDGTVLIGAIQSVNPIVNTTYTVTIDDGCTIPTQSLNVVISTYGVPQLVVSSDVNSGCEDLEVEFTNSTDQTLVATTYWDFGNGFTSTSSSVSQAQVYTDPGCYDVTIQITTVDGCLVDSVLTNFICVYELPVADFTYNPEDPDMLNSEVNFENLSTAGTTYSWLFGDGNSSVEFEPSTTYPEIGAVTYQVELTVMTDDGCVDVAVQNITINEVIQFYAPNAMTPNGDPFNPDFLPVFIPGFTPLAYTLQIYNRWGEILFESQDITVGWDGTYNGVIVNEDVYVWKIQFRENQTDFVHKHFGHISVLK